MRIWEEEELGLQSIERIRKERRDRGNVIIAIP